MSKLFSNSFYIALDRWTFLCHCIDFCLKNEDRKKGRIQNASKHLRWKALHLRCLRQSWLYLWKNATAQKMKIFWKSAETAVWSHLLKKSFHGKLYFLQCAIPLFIFIETSGIRQLDVSWKFSFVKFQENFRKTPKPDHLLKNIFLLKNRTPCPVSYREFAMLLKTSELYSNTYPEAAPRRCS